MHPYFTRLGIRKEVQTFFAPFCGGDEHGNIVFNYGDAAEHFGIAFHRIPVSEHCWFAGNPDFNLVSHVFICSSAMEAIAFYNYRYAVYPNQERMLFLALGSKPNAPQFRWIAENLAGKNYRLVFGDTLLDKAGELITAAALSKLPLSVVINKEQVAIQFRLKEYLLPIATFSLNAFEKVSGYRFAIRTAGPKSSESYFLQLKSAAFNH